MDVFFAACAAVGFVGMVWTLPDAWCYLRGLK